MGGPSGPPCFEYSTLSYAQLLRASPALGRRALRLPVAQGGAQLETRRRVTWRRQQREREREVSAGEVVHIACAGSFPSSIFVMYRRKIHQPPMSGWMRNPHLDIGTTNLYLFS